MTDRHWHEDRRSVGRWEDRGLDHGSSGTIVAEVRHGNRIVARLMWFAGHRTPVCGIRGFGHRYVPAQLNVVDGHGYWKKTILEGGRLSKARLNEHAGLIDAAMGDGVAALADPSRTLVVVRPPQD